MWRTLEEDKGIRKLPRKEKWKIERVYRLSHFSPFLSIFPPYIFVAILLHFSLLTILLFFQHRWKIFFQQQRRTSRNLNIFHCFPIFFIDTVLHCSRFISFPWYFDEKKKKGGKSCFNWKEKEEIFEKKAKLNTKTREKRYGVRSSGRRKKKKRKKV